MNNPTCKFSGKGVYTGEHINREIDRESTNVYIMPEGK